MVRAAVRVGVFSCCVVKRLPRVYAGCYLVASSTTSRHALAGCGFFSASLSLACQHRHCLSILAFGCILSIGVHHWSLIPAPSVHALQLVLVGVLMLRPQIVSKPAALLHDAIKAIVDQGRAQAEVAKSNRGVWRPA